jgi:serine/threonine-protein kinase RsbW
MEDATPPRRVLFLTATLSDLARIREFVEAQATDLGVPAGEIPTLILAVDEAATNVIIHGYHRQGGPIEVEVALEQATLMVYLRDLAPVFDPTRVPPPDLSIPLFDRPPGGLGIHLMRQTMDELIHRPRPGGGNELIMLRRGM